MIELRADDRDLWQAALTRAIERGTKAYRGVVRRDGIPQVLVREVWDAPSYSDPGVRHIVVLDFDAEAGEERIAKAVQCECLAGQALTPCHHAAAVIEARGAWPWPMARQQRMDGL